jgi:hypothetical protein
VAGNTLTVDYDPILPYASNVLDVDKIWLDMPGESRQQLGSWLADGVGAYNGRIRQEVRQGINSGALVGVDAFAAIEGMGYSDQVYHGAGKLPDQLEGNKLQPHQAYWRDGDGQVYEDGQPAVCFAPDKKTAIVTSLFGRRRTPGTEETFWAYGRSPQGRVWHMVSSLALEQASHDTACVYTTDEHKVPQHVFEHHSSRRERSVEYRSLQSIDYKFAVRVGICALPPDVLVVDADRKTSSSVWKAMMDGVHPLDLSHVASIRPVGGAWDIGDHPTMR